MYCTNCTVTLVTLVSLVMFYFTCIVVTTCFHVSLVWTRNNKTERNRLKKIDDANILTSVIFTYSLH